MKKTTFFRNEDLDNILRGMEGLTTDEKEAYLDARLKELESLPDSRKKELQEAARTGMKRTLELASHISVMNELQRIGNVVSFASIAKDYFGKSKFWIHQRINGYLVNGKPACFTNEQIVRMAEALEDIAKQMQELQEKFVLAERLHAMEIQNVNIRLSLAEKEMCLMQSIINPHFLFNCLATISSSAILENAPQTQAGCVVVPKVMA